MKKKIIGFMSVCFLAFLSMLAIASCGAESTASVKSIEVTTQPAKTAYYTNEKFDTAGFVLTATHNDGTKSEVNDYLYEKKALCESDKYVHIYYGGLVTAVRVNVSPILSTGISDIKDYENGTLLFVEGYCVEHSGADTMLVKDIKSSDIISVHDVSFDYSVGDRVKFLATLTKSENESYLMFSDGNVDKESTLVSSENAIEYDLEKASGIGALRRMKQLFTQTDVNAIKQYTYVKFSGAMYFTKSGSDIAIHMDANASDASSIKPDRVRSVIIKGGNLGTDWLSSHIDLSSSDEYPGALADGILYAFYIGMDAENYYLTVLDSSWINLTQNKVSEEEITVNQAAVREVAYAFYYRGTYIHYDQYNSRRNINPSPELATSQRIVYLDCSSFVNAVYYETFGENVMPYPITEKRPQTGNFQNYVLENPDAVDVIGFWDTDDYTTDDARQAVIDSLKSQLQIGDVLNYRKTGGTGHV